MMKSWGNRGETLKFTHERIFLSLPISGFSDLLVIKMVEKWIRPSDLKNPDKDYRTDEKRTERMLLIELIFR